MKTTNRTPNEVKRIAKACFPEYRGRKFKVREFRPTTIYSYWFEGSREFYALYNLEDGRIYDAGQFGTPYDGRGTLTLGKLPANHLLVKHTIFCGKDLGITIFANQENLARWHESCLPKKDLATY